MQNRVVMIRLRVARNGERTDHPAGNSVELADLVKNSRLTETCTLSLKSESVHNRRIHFYDGTRVWGKSHALARRYCWAWRLGVSSVPQNNNGVP